MADNSRHGPMAPELPVCELTHRRLQNAPCSYLMIAGVTLNQSTLEDLFELYACEDFSLTRTKGKAMLSLDPRIAFREI